MVTSAADGAMESRPLAPRLSPEFHRERIEEVCTRCEDGLILLRGEYDWFRKRELRSFDPAYRDTNFKQEKNLYYLSGIEVPDSFVLIDPRKELRLYTDWQNPRELEAARTLGVVGIHPTGAFLRDARIYGASCSWMYTLYVPFLEDGPMFTKTSVMTGLFPPGMGDPVPEETQFAHKLAQVFPDHRIRSLYPILAEMRKIKHPEEVRLLREANAAAVRGVWEGMRVLQPGLYDHDVAAAVEAAMRRRGAAAATFSHNLMSGPNIFEKLVHLWADYSHLDRQLQDGDAVFIDVGAEVGYYVSDIGRTAPVSGKFSPEQRKLYEIYLPCYLAALRHVRPGVTQRDLVTVCVQAMQRQLDGLIEDYLKAAALNFIAMTSVRPTLGHYLDTDVIGMGARPDEPLRAGMVFAIEPILYCPEKRFGAFVEDNVLVTESGCEVLSSGLPYTVDEIEATVASAS